MDLRGPEMPLATVKGCRTLSAFFARSPPDACFSADIPTADASRRCSARISPTSSMDCCCSLILCIRRESQSSSASNTCPSCGCLFCLCMERDPFGTAEEVESALKLIPAKVRLLRIEGAGHDLGFKGKAKQDELPALVMKEFSALLG